MLIPLLSLVFFLQATDNVPFRAKDDFQVELKYDIKARPTKDPTTLQFDINQTEQKRSGGPLPYLIVHVKVANVKEDEVKFKCENNLGTTVFSKKVPKDNIYKIDMGYLDDVKDRVTPYQYTLYAINDKREAINKVVLLVQEDGTFLVNGEKRGKF